MNLDLILLGEKKNPWKPKQRPWQMALVSQVGSACRAILNQVPRRQAGGKAVEDDMNDVS